MRQIKKFVRHSFDGTFYPRYQPYRVSVMVSRRRNRVWLVKRNLIVDGHNDLYSSNSCVERDIYSAETFLGRVSFTDAILHTTLNNICRHAPDYSTALALYRGDAEAWLTFVTRQADATRDLCWVAVSDNVRRLAEIVSDSQMQISRL
jgi:hypothetical protein